MIWRLQPKRIHIQMQNVLLTLLQRVPNHSLGLRFSGFPRNKKNKNQGVPKTKHVACMHAYAYYIYIICMYVYNYIYIRKYTYTYTHAACIYEICYNLIISRCPTGEACLNVSDQRQGFLGSFLVTLSVLWWSCMEGPPK